MLRSKILLWLLAAFASGLAPQVAAQSAPKVLTPEQWREDLRFMAGEIRQRHPNPYHHVPKTEFDRAVADLDAKIPNLERNQIVVGMMRIAAMVGDGHTRVEPRKDPAFGFPSLPLKFYLFDDGVFIRAARSEHKELLGARLEAVGGVPVEEALRRVSELASRENAMGPKLYAPLYLAMPDILQAIGLSNDRTSATLTLSRNGRRWDVAVKADHLDPSWPPDTDISLMTPPGWLDAHAGTPAMWLQAPLTYHRLIDLPDRDAVYAQVNMITDVDGETLGQFGEKILARAVAANPKAIILDLRLAQGGNGDLRTDLIRSLIKAEDPDTRLYVLTARGTFSASQFLLDDLDRLTSAAFVGEPASSSPTGYGDGYRSQMPNSRIAVRTSILHWQSGQNLAPWTYVDIATPYRFADYAAGRDPALEAALSLRRPADLGKVIMVLPANATAEAVRAAVAGVVDDPALAYADK